MLGISTIPVHSAGFIEALPGPAGNFDGAAAARGRDSLFRSVSGVRLLGGTGRCFLSNKFVGRIALQKMQVWKEVGREIHPVYSM